MKRHGILFLFIKISLNFCYEYDRDPFKIPALFYPCHYAATRDSRAFLDSIDKKYDASFKKNPLMTKQDVAFEVDGQGWTPLHWACQEQNEAVVTHYLVAYPYKDFHALKAKSGVTPFGLAYKKNNESLIKLLTVHEFTRLLSKKLQENDYAYELEALQYASESAVSQFEKQYKLTHYNIEAILFDDLLVSCVQRLLEDFE